MTKHSPIPPKPSLLERAAAVYDFGAAIRAPAPGVATPPPGPTVAPKPIDPSWLATPATGRTAAVAIDELRDAGFILPDAPVSALAEEFRIVKRQLLLAAAGGGKEGDDPLDRGRMILVASAQPDEGKTFCAVNLALSLASEKDFEVLLVDADFAKPEILSTLGLATGGNGAGLIDAIADPGIAPETLVIGTDIANLSVMPAGRATNDATELLASARTRTVLDGLVAQRPRRVVIFDSAPALAASSASVLALHVGQVLMVVRADQTSEDELREALSLLAGCGSVQLLLNGAVFSPNGRRFGAYYGYGN